MLELTRIRQQEFVRAALGDTLAAPNGGRTFAVRDPATEDQIAEVPDVGIAGATAAIEAAHRAFAGWSRWPADERSEVLRRAARSISERTEALAWILTSENGKPITEARAEVGAAARHVQWSAEEGRRVYGRVIPAPAPDRRFFALKQPVGVVAAITPWNFPASMVTRKVSPALAAGCTVVLRPASATPLTALAIEAIFREAGLPEGVFRVVTVRESAEVGKLFATHPLVRKITFTGSTEVGKSLTRIAAGTMKRVSMELGGHAPFLVFPDADLSRVVDAVIATKYRNAGQTCISTNRLYAERSIASELAQSVAERAATLTLGHGLDNETRVGPLIDRRALDRVGEQVDDAVGGGASIVTGGRPARVADLSGAFYEPTVLMDVPASSRVMHEETFGPLLPVASFTSEEEAIAAANQTSYGLAAYAFTRDLGRAFRLAEGLEYGIVGINDPSPLASQLPFGGFKESGVGRELGAEGLDEFLEVKAVSISLQ